MIVDRIDRSWLGSYTTKVIGDDHHSRGTYQATRMMRTFVGMLMRIVNSDLREEDATHRDWYCSIIYKSWLISGLEGNLKTWLALECCCFCCWWLASSLWLLLTCTVDYQPWIVANADNNPWLMIVLMIPCTKSLGWILFSIFRNVLQSPYMVMIYDHSQEPFINSKNITAARCLSSDGPTCL